MSQEYTITKIGKISLGIDGADEFFKVECDEPIDKGELREHFHNEFYYETTQEAGGYFCKRFEIFQSHYDHDAVVKVEHRYDV